MDRLIINYAKTIIKFRWLVILLALLSVIGAGYGAKNLGFSNNYRAFFSQENPELTAFETFQNTYTKNDNILFVIKPKTQKVFSANVMDAVEKITEEAWQIPYAIRVDSLTNFQYSYADGDDLIVEDLVYDAKSLSDEYLATRQDIALKEPLLKGLLIANDAKATGINVVLQFPEKSISEVPASAGYAKKIADQIRAEYPDLDIALTGVSMMNDAFAEAGKKDSMTLMPIMFAILMLVMIVTLRSFSATFATFMVINFSLVIAMGIAGYLGILLTPISVTAPTIILTLAIADSIHILVSAFQNMRQGASKQDALVDSIRVNFMPVSITSLTTIVGFLTLNFSDSPPFWDLGNITAIGICAAWLYSLTFLPALLSLLPLKVKVKQGAADKDSLLTRWLESHGRFVVKYRRSVLSVMTLIAVALIAALPQIELNDQWVEYFDESIEFRRDADFGMEHLTGVYQVEFSIPAKNAGGVSEPEYLMHLDNFANWLRGVDGVRHVNSVTDIMKRLNKNLNGDDPAWHKLPESRPLAAQYLLLYEMSLPYGLDLNDRINIDKSASRITATLDNVTTQQVRGFIENSQGWLKDNAPEYMMSKPTGATVMFSYISQRNIEGMLKGNAIAIIAISLILMLALRSVKLGALSIIPNAIPILMTFGIWALTFNQIGMAAAGVSAVALGIVVDDTVHFMSKYLRARREKGLNKADASIYAFKTVGAALVVTTIVLTAGFLVMSTSSFMVNEQLGLMTAATMIVALIIDFTLLPSLLLLGNKDKATEDEQQDDV
jgi:predicted RND superfamily exporter protein|tara:strand:- start:36297 stop:38636 length:2340 start_codon:yes stop_codon:yes gene_type:complete